MDIVIAAAVGALAAILGNTIPSMLRVRAEHRAAATARAENRLLHLAELRERLLESDAMAISEAVDAVVTNLRDTARLGAAQQALRGLQTDGNITAEDVQRKEEQLVRDLEPRSAELNQALVRGSRRAFSFGGHIRQLFLRIDGLAGRLHKAMLGQAEEDQDALWFEITEAGGTLQAALRAYLIRSAATALEETETVVLWDRSPPSKPHEAGGASRL